MIEPTPIEVAAAIARIDALLSFHSPVAVRFEFRDVQILRAELNRRAQDAENVRKQLARVWAQINDVEAA